MTAPSGIQHSSSSISLFDGWRGLVSRLQQQTMDDNHLVSGDKNSTPLHSSQTPFTSNRTEIIYRLQQDVDQAERKKWLKMLASQSVVSNQTIILNPVDISPKNINITNHSNGISSSSSSTV
jgi:hypothetical protein